MTLVELEEIIALQELIVEFNERKASFQPHLVRFEGEHPVDGEMPAYIAEEVDVVEIGQPVLIVVRVQGLPVEGHEIVKLREKAAGVGVDLLIADDLSHGRLAGRIAYPRRSAAHQDDGVVSGFVEMPDREIGHHMPDMQRRSCGIAAFIQSDRSFVHEFGQSFHVRALLDEPSFFQYF